MMTKEKKSSNQANPINHGSDNMKQGWEIKKLGEVCKLTNGYAFQSKEYTDDGYFVIRIGNVQDGYIELNNPRYIKLSEEKQKKFILSEGDILVSLTGNVGRVGEIKEEHLPAVLNQRVAKISLNSKSLHKAYLLYFLTSEYFITELIKAGRGAAQQNISTTDIENLIIPLPPLPEQQRIVSILDEAFAAIAKAKANAEQNLKNAKELFESYLQGVFEKLFEERETKRISEVAKVIGGYSFKSGDFKKEGKYQVIRMGNVRPGIIRENESPVFIDEMEEKGLLKALLIPKDVIITQTGTKNKRDYGFTVIIEKENYLLNQRIAAIRFKKDYLPEFFLYFSWTNIFKDQYFANETGTVGQGNVGIGAITDSQVPSIPLKEQQAIVRQLDALRAEKQKLEAVYQKKIADLEELKKSILQKAFAGELSEPLINAD